MNFTLLFFLVAIMFGLLWVSTKFLGKTGLITFVVASYALSVICVNISIINLYQINIINITALGGFVNIGIVALTAGTFALYLVFKKYGVAEGLKSLAIVFTFAIVYALASLLINLYTTMQFFKALEITLLPVILTIFAISIGVAVAYFLFVSKLFKKFNDSFRAFLILIIALFVFSFINVMLGQIGDYTFTTMLLNWIIEFMFEVVILGIFFVCERLLVYNENITLGENLHEKLKATIEKAKSSMIKEENNEDKDDDDDDDEDEDNDDDEKNEIVVEDDKKE